MEKLLEEEFFHFGSNNILKELWLNIQTCQSGTNYIKPYGGIWTSHTNNYSICDWLEYKEEKDPMNFDIYVGQKPSCLVKFKDDSKLLKIENNNDFKNLKDSGYTKKLETPIEINRYTFYTKIIDEIIDYDKIANEFDLLYVSNIYDDYFRNYSVISMLGLNPESIEYYKSVEADYINHQIIKVGEKQYVAEPTQEYSDLINKIRALFTNIDYKNYDDYILKLSIMKKELEEKTIELIRLSNIKRIQGINNLLIAKTILGNIYKEKYSEVQKKLLKTT